MMTQKNIVEGQKQGYRPSASTLMMVNAIMLAGAAHAQSQTNTPPVTAGASTNAPTKLPDVIITGEKANDETSYQPQAVQTPKFTAPLLDTPQTITVIPRAVIEERGAATLRDILRNVPGISMQAGEGGGGLAGDNLSIRGFSARSDMFIDGVRDYGAYSRDAFNVEQVEIWKGPSSATTGRGSTGGSINLASKTPKPENFYGGSLGYGTDDYKRTTLDVNQSLEGDKGIKGAAVRLNAMWHDADAPGRDVVNESRWAVAPSIAFGLGTPTRLTLSWLHMEQDNVPDYGIPWVPATQTQADLVAYANQAPPVDFNNFYGLVDHDFESVYVNVATAVLEHDFSDSVRFRNLTRYTATDRDSAITAPRFAAAGTTVINRQLQRREINNEAVANQTDLNFDFDTGPVEHKLVTGMEFVVERQENANIATVSPAGQPQTDIFNPNPYDAPTAPMVALPPHNTATSHTVAFYLFDTLKLSEKWHITGGLRYDHIDSKFNNPVPPALSLQNGDDLVSYRGAVIFKPAANGSIYFGYGTSFNASLDGNTGQALTAATANIDPESSQTFELGTKWDLLKERLSVNAAVFRTEKTNARTVDPLTPTITVLEGEQLVQGFELGAAGSITPEWKVFAGYTWMESEVLSSKAAGEQGSELSQTPEHSFSVWTTYDLPFGLQLGGGASFVGDRNNSNVSSTTRVAPSYYTFDAMASYRINEHVSVQLNVYNLANERYIDSVGGGHFVPGAGRSAVLSANFRF